MLAVALLALLAAPAAQQEPGGFVIFAPDQTAALLRHCSRGAPKPGESGWIPSMADVARMEAKLPGALRLMRPDPFARKELADVPKGWARQYVGIVRGGKRYIYGNFIPSDMASDPRYHWRERSIDVCDGGPGFFGAEYDVEKDAIDHLAFNGLG